MNIKQVIKFILLSFILSIVYKFFLGMLFGILGAFFKDMNVSLSAMSLVKNIVTAFIVIPVIATSARIIYKKIPAPKEQVAKIALTVTLTTLVMDGVGLSLLMATDPKLGTSLYMYLILDLILTYTATVYFVKRYSN